MGVKVYKVYDEFDSELSDVLECSDNISSLSTKLERRRRIEELEEERRLREELGDF